MFGILTSAVVILTSVPDKDIYEAESDYLYECGLQLKQDGMVVEGKVFKDIPIGIAVWSDYNRIRDCVFMNCSDEGVLVLGDYNFFVNCVFWRCVDGVELQNVRGNIFINCQFLGNSHMGVDGIGYHNYKNVFNKCTFYKSTVWFRSWNTNLLIDCYYLDV